MRMVRAALVVLAASALLAGACSRVDSRSEPPPRISRSEPPPRIAAARETPDADPADDATVALPIPPRRHASEAPPEGWCGETAIQEALLYVGVWAPQRLIHRAGRPVHPDLYSNEIPIALAALGVQQSAYAGGEPYGRFVRRALDEGDPVIAGVKILPTAHPSWGLDHFVLAIGYGPRGLLVDTTWGYREWIADEGGTPKTEGLSLKNAFYAIRITRPRAARLAVVEERGAEIRLRVTCAGRVERAAIPDDHAPKSWTSTDAAVDVVPAQNAWSYTCGAD